MKKRVETFSFKDWNFSTSKGPICDIPEAETISRTILRGAPIPTITFPSNGLLIEHVKSKQKIEFTTRGALQCISPHAPKNIKVASSRSWRPTINPDTGLTSITRETDYDWTYWSAYDGDWSNAIETTETTTVKTSTPTPEEEGGYSEDVFGDSRLASKSEKMMYFCSVDLYEDEIGDAGSLTIVRLRCLLVIDDVLVRCRERRFYHEFDIFDDQTRDQMSHSSMERPQSFQFSNNLEENNLTKTADKSSFDEFKGLKNDASKMSRKPTLYLTSLQKNNPEIPRLSNHNYQHVVIIQSQVLQKERSFSHILKDQGGMFIGMRDHDAIASNLMMQVPKLEDLCTNNLLKMFY